MLTRKHFRQMAATVDAIQEEGTKRAVYAAYVVLSRDSNPRFDEGLFWDASGMNPDDADEIQSLIDVAQAELVRAR